jgi:NAD(P)-dependent dehydrogenase (short-subunit alcohol dehydrogenase family)
MTVDKAESHRPIPCSTIPTMIWQATISTNVTGAFRSSQRAARLMIPRR